MYVLNLSQPGRPSGEGVTRTDQPVDERDEHAPAQAICGVPGSADGARRDHAYGRDYRVR